MPKHIDQAIITIDSNNNFEAKISHFLVFFKGIFFPFVPIEEWSHKTTVTAKLVEQTTMRPKPAEVMSTSSQIYRDIMFSINY